MTQILLLLISFLIPSLKPCLPFVASAKKDLPTCLQSLPTLEPKLKFANKFIRSPIVSDFLNLYSEFKPLLPYTNSSYLILLQNNNELRANGGFFGSYAVITINSQLSTVNSPLDYSIHFQDIYVPDGQITGHIDPPAPIQTAFKQGWWRLRDADWEPDFPTSAKTIRWFLEKGNEINPDFLITLNLNTIEKIAKIIGEIDVPEYNFKLNSDNLYTLLQNQAETNFFPGSTQKKDVLTATGNALTKKLSTLKPKQLIQIAQVVTDQLNHSNLLVNAINPDVQKILEDKHWAGELSIVNCQLSNCLNDTFLLVETNLGANKANCCVERITKHVITRGETEISHLVNLTLTNTSPLENPLPPRFYGGNYISYLRFYLPKNATNIRITAQPTLPKTLAQYPKPFDGITNKEWQFSIVNFPLSIFKELGFFHLTAAGTKSAVQLSYDLPLNCQLSLPVRQAGIVHCPLFVNYQLNILKQNGLESSPTEINLFGKSESTNLENDYTINLPLTNI